MKLFCIEDVILGHLSQTYERADDTSSINIQFPGGKKAPLTALLRPSVYSNLYFSETVDSFNDYEGNSTKRRLTMNKVEMDRNREYKVT